MKSVYEETYVRSLADPAGFWAAAAEDLHWDRRWDRVFDDSRPPYYRWFTGGMLNTCYNALDLHVDRGRGKQRALVYDSPVTDTIRVFTYAELRDAVARVAGGGAGSAARALHVRHHRHSQGSGARQGRPRRRAQVVDERRVRDGRRRDVLGGLGHRLGRRPQLHRLRAAAEGVHDDPL